MVLVDQIAKKEMIRQAIDTFADDELAELASFVAYLQFKSHAKEKGWFEKVYDLLEPVRDAIEQSGMSEQEVDAAIDDAIREVRGE